MHTKDLTEKIIQSLGARRKIVCPYSGVMTHTEKSPMTYTGKLLTSKGDGAILGGLNLSELNHMREIAKILSAGPKKIVKSKVVIVKGDNKITNMDEFIAKSSFFNRLENRLKKSGKTKEEFSVIIKPNLMMATHKEEPPVTYVEPDLIHHLVDRLAAKGFKNVKLVESQNMYGNWFVNRDVKNVARVVGLTGVTEKGNKYEVVDLTEEMVEHDYGPDSSLKKHFIGPTWRDADYRIDFGKNKTHMSNAYTCALKTIYGCTPMQNKASEYHGLRDWELAALDMLKNPKHNPDDPDSNPQSVDFVFVDAEYSADGLLGWKGTTDPKHTKMIFGGDNPVAVDIQAGKMMGLRPQDSVLTWLAMNQFGQPEIDLDSNVPKDYKHENWSFIDTKFLDFDKMAVPKSESLMRLLNYINAKAPLLWQILIELSAESYVGFTLGGLVSNGMSGDKMDAKEFPMKPWGQLGKEIKRDMIKNMVDLAVNPNRRKEILKKIVRLLPQGRRPKSKTPNPTNLAKLSTKLGPSQLFSKSELLNLFSKSELLKLFSKAELA